MAEQLPPPTGSPVELAKSAERTPKVIVWAFILSLFGFLILTAFAAIAMTITGWKQVKSTGKGKGLAIAALIISGFWIILLAFAFANPSDDAPQTSTEETVEVVESETTIEQPEAETITEDPSIVNRAQFGEEWPFAVDEGVIRCDVIETEGINDLPAIIVTLDKEDYALNGVAISRGFTELTIDSDIWLDNEMTGAKVLLTAVTQRALALCGELAPGSTPNATPDQAQETVGYKLAVIDGEFDQSSIQKYERRIEQVSDRCQEPEASTGDKVVKATQLLDERGITENNLWVMDSILQAIPLNEVGTFDCAEVIAFLVTLRIAE